MPLDVVGDAVEDAGSLARALEPVTKGMVGRLAAVREPVLPDPCREMVRDALGGVPLPRELRPTSL
jgi:hypothetical protein